MMSRDTWHDAERLRPSIQPVSRTYSPHHFTLSTIIYKRVCVCVCVRARASLCARALLLTCVSS